MNTSDILGLTGNLTAGAAITQDSNGRYPLVELFPNGYAYPVQNIQYAVTANVSNNLSSVYNPPTYDSSFYTWSNQAPNPIQCNDGSLIFVTNSGSSGSGLALVKYDIQLYNQIGINTIISGNVRNIMIALLSNGNIVVVWANSTAGNWYFGIYNQNLTQIVAPTIIGNASGNYPGVLTALTGGGFAVNLKFNTTVSGSGIAAYSNTGTQLLAPTLLLASPATVANSNGTSYIIQALSNGSFLAATVASSGTSFTYSVYTNTGTQVVAPTATSFSGSGNICASSLSGYFAIGYNQTGTYPNVSVYNNSGTLQGTAYTYGGASQKIGDIVNDGTNFYAVSVPTSSYVSIATIPITGGASASYITTVGIGLTNSAIKANLNNGVLTFVSYTSGTVSPIFYSYNLSNNSLLTRLTNPFSYTPSSTVSYINGISSIGDGAYCIWADMDNLGYYILIKLTNTGIQGVATSTASIGGVFSVKTYGQTGNGYNAAIQTVLGNAGSFNHTYGSGNNIPGAQGGITPNSATIKGL